MAKYKKKKSALGLCLGLFAAVLAVCLLVVLDPVGALTGADGGAIILSEVLASNRTYPDSQGRFLDFIEVRNTSDRSVDISGYMLSDDPVSVGYTFPSGTVLGPGGYAVVYCDKDDDSGRYAQFGISRKGGETLYLYNSANVAVDTVELPKMNANVPLVRLDDGSWGTFSQATPGQENSGAGYQKWLHAMGGDSAKVVITEVMTGNSCLYTDDTGRVYDWVELYNAGDRKAVLDGAYLSNDPADPAKYQISKLTLQPGQYAVIRCAGTEAQVGEATFGLRREGVTVVLTGKLGNTLSRVEVPLMEGDHSWALGSDGDYALTDMATPGQENTPAGYSAWLAATKAPSMQVHISEVMSANRGTLLSAGGSFCDWVELYNGGSEAAVLDGAWLSDDRGNRGMYKIESLTLLPGEYAYIPCAGTEAAPGEANFALSAGGCTVVLSAPGGAILSAVEVPRLEDDRVYALQPEGDWLISDMATPGQPNTEEGRLAHLNTRAPLGALAISEVMPSNDRYLVQWDGNYYDWVELQNVSQSPLELSRYSLATDLQQPFRLPQKTLQPGERVVIICSGNTQLQSSHIQAPFTVSREEDWVYVLGPDGLSDFMHIYEVPYQASVGRAQGSSAPQYFATPTPSAANGTGGGVFTAAAPSFATAGGVYNNVSGLEVTVEGSGTVRYTLDGSIPTERSAQYTGPISLTATTVVRAACFEPGKLPSQTVTASYIINENHTLPVLSVAADPGSFSYMYTNYRQDRETYSNLTLYEEGGGFSLDCGLEMHGHTGLENPKKSFKVNFRSRYGEAYLRYPLYGEDGPRLYSSLLIRAGQDYPMSMIREELFTTLCSQMSDTVLIQKSKFVVLYVNGEYRGVYSLKEAYSETYYAQNRGVSEQSVSILQAPVLPGSEMFSLIRYIDSHDMSLQENYDYVAARLDLDSLIDWMIIEAYSTNGDVQQNLRYFKSSENGDRWQFAFYDLDWAWYYHTPFRNVLSYNTHEEWQHTDMCVGMMKNPTFRKRFFERLSYYMEHVLTNENVLSVIDGLYNELKPEMTRERQRWGGSYQGWENSVNKLRRFITDYDLLGTMVTNLQKYVGMTQKETQTYFGRWS